MLCALLSTGSGIAEEPVSRAQVDAAIEEAESFAREYSKVNLAVQYLHRFESLYPERLNSLTNSYAQLGTLKTQLASTLNQNLWRSTIDLAIKTYDEITFWIELPKKTIIELASDKIMGMPKDAILGKIFELSAVNSGLSELASTTDTNLPEIERLARTLQYSEENVRARAAHAGIDVNTDTGLLYYHYTLSLEAVDAARTAIYQQRLKLEGVKNAVDTDLPALVIRQLAMHAELVALQYAAEQLSGLYYDGEAAAKAALAAEAVQEESVITQPTPDTSIELPSERAAALRSEAIAQINASVPAIVASIISQTAAYEAIYAEANDAMDVLAVPSTLLPELTAPFDEEQTWVNPIFENVETLGGDSALEDLQSLYSDWKPRQPYANQAVADLQGSVDTLDSLVSTGVGLTDRYIDLKVWIDFAHGVDQQIENIKPAISTQTLAYYLEDRLVEWGAALDIHWDGGSTVWGNEVFDHVGNYMGSAISAAGFASTYQETLESWEYHEQRIDDFIAMAESEFPRILQLALEEYSELSETLDALDDSYRSCISICNAYQAWIESLDDGAYATPFTDWDVRTSWYLPDDTSGINLETVFSSSSYTYNLTDEKIAQLPIWQATAENFQKRYVQARGLVFYWTYELESFFDGDYISARLSDLSVASDRTGLFTIPAGSYTERIVQARDAWRYDLDPWRKLLALPDVGPSDDPYLETARLYDPYVTIFEEAVTGWINLPLAEFEQRRLAVLADFYQELRSRDPQLPMYDSINRVISASTALVSEYYYSHSELTFAPAQITQQPVSVTIAPDGTATFRVECTGDLLRYSWTEVDPNDPEFGFTMEQGFHTEFTTPPLTETTSYYVIIIQPNWQMLNSVIVTANVNASGSISYTMIQPSITVAPEGGPYQNQLTVNATAGLSTDWTATPNNDWITMQSGSYQGTGSQVIEFQVNPNRDGYPRRGTVTIGGTIFEVNQEPLVENYTQWQQLQFGDDAGLPGTGSDDDFNNDGFSNDQARRAGFSATEIINKSAISQNFVAHLDSDFDETTPPVQYFCHQFRMSRTINSVVTLSTSSDLTTWNASEEPLVPIEELPDAWLYGVNIPIDNQKVLFLKLQYSENE